MATTLERLRTILVQENKLLPDRLTLDSPLEELGIDSLGTVELLWNIEDTFNIKLPPEPVDLLTLGDVVHFVDELIASQGLSPVQSDTVIPQAHAR